MAASFSHSGGTVTFRPGSAYPEAALLIIQPERQSAARSRVGFDQTIINDTINLTLRLTDSEKTALETFFHATVRGQADSFTYTNPAGTAYTVRFAAALTLQEKACNAWLATIILRRA